MSWPYQRNICHFSLGPDYFYNIWDVANEYLRCRMIFRQLLSTVISCDLGLRWIRILEVKFVYQNTITRKAHLSIFYWGIRLKDLRLKE